MVHRVREDDSQLKRGKARFKRWFTAYARMTAQNDTSIHFVILTFQILFISFTYITEQ